MTETILATLSLVIITIYLAVYVLSRGVPSSISATYYQTEARWLFPTVITLSGVLAWIPMLNYTPENFQFLAFLTCGAIVFVAASPAFKDEFVGKIHAGAASVLGLSAVTWCIIVAGVPYLAIAGLIIGLLRRKQFVFWLEVGILANIYLNLFIQLHICSSISA